MPVYDIAKAGGQVARVTVPYAESEYRSILASQGGGWSIVGGILGGLAEAAGNVLFGGHQLPVPAPPPLPMPSTTQTGVGFPELGDYTVFPARRPRGHWKKDGTWSNRARPKMQCTNTRALKRAMKRVQCFAALAKKTISFTSKVKMKKRRK